MSRIQLRDGDGYRLVEATGCLDSRTPESRELERVLRQPAGEIDRHYAFDLAGVDYINSSMLGGFVRFFGEIQRAGYRMVLLRPPQSVRMVLDVTGLSQLLPVVGDETDLAAALNEAPVAGHLIEVEDVDYEALTQEIDALIRGDASDTQRGGQLARILGRD
jgi:anti-anti-sigma factor